MNLLLSCIGRRGYIADWFREQLGPDDRIMGTTNNRWTPGLHACDRGVLLPDLGSDAYLPALLQLCRDERIGPVLSFVDSDVARIAGARDAFVATGAVPIVPDAWVSRICLDKLETDRFLRANGIRSPATVADLGSAMAALHEGSLRLPLFVKPRFGSASQDVFLARNEAELRVFFDYAPDMLIQEQVAGLEHSLDVLNDLEGRVVSVVVKRKILMRAGETDQAETVHHREALALGARLGALLGHRGPLDVDLFIDGDDVTVLELNPRFGGAYPSAHLAGADFPRKIVAMARGEHVEPRIGDYAAGVQMMKGIAILPRWTGDPIDLRAAGTT